MRGYQVQRLLDKSFKLEVGNEHIRFASEIGVFYRPLSRFYTYDPVNHRNVIKQSILH